MYNWNMLKHEQDTEISKERKKNMRESVAIHRPIISFARWLIRYIYFALAAQRNNYNFVWNLIVRLQWKTRRKQRWASNKSNNVHH